MIDVRTRKPVSAKELGIPFLYRIPLWIGSALYGLAMSLIYVNYRLCKPSAAIHNAHNLDKSRPLVYNEIAIDYDRKNTSDEVLGGIGWLRNWICRNIKGDILEASCGTGRNITSYDMQKITSITMLDQSKPMLQIAEQKWKDLALKVPATFIALPMEVMDPARSQYDTILQTFGLCSVADPVGYLSHLAKFLRPGGSIVLVEHGRSSHDWVNGILDRTAEEHAQKWGCYRNRDIEVIVQLCSSIKTDKLERYHLGTTYVYNLSVH